MTDTPRSLSALLALFSDDQGIGAITPQDMRDLIVSFNPPCGGFYITTPIATPIAEAGTFVKALGTTTITMLNGMTMPISNRLVYTGAPDRSFHISASMSFTSLGANDNVSLAIAKNGSVLDHSELTRFLASGNDQGSTSVHADAVLSTNDYFELFVTNEDDTMNFTMQQAYLFALGIII